MPTKKRRVGFIPRNDVLKLINKLSFESNLSNSKIINILVEEALCQRGIYNIETGSAYSHRDKNIKTKIEYSNKKSTNDFIKKSSRGENHSINERYEEESLDDEIYQKFLMFLKFQERMKIKER